jgi:hypothetical protein
MSPLKKVEVSDKCIWKMRTAMVKYHYDINELTIGFIKKNKAKLRGASRPVLPWVQACPVTTMNRSCVY